MVPGRDSNLGRKFHRNHGLIAVGLFELPARLPSNYMHWCDIRRYRVLAVDTDFQSGLEDRRRTYVGRTSAAHDVHDGHQKDNRRPPRITQT